MVHFFMIRDSRSGNDRFKLGDNQGALVKYRLALDKVKGLSLVDESDAALMRQVSDPTGRDDCRKRFICKRFRVSML